MSAARTPTHTVEIQFRSYARTLWAHGGDVAGLTLSRRNSRFLIERQNDDSSVSQPFGSATHSASEMWDMLRFAIDSLQLTPQLRSEGSSGVSILSVNVTAERMPASAAHTYEDLGRSSRDEQRAAEIRKLGTLLAPVGTFGTSTHERDEAATDLAEVTAQARRAAEFARIDRARESAQLDAIEAELAHAEAFGTRDSSSSFDDMPAELDARSDSTDFGELSPEAVAESDAHAHAVFELVKRGRWNERQAALIVSYRASIGASLLSSIQYATGRAETDPCDAGTVGCSVDHSMSDSDTACESY